METVSVPAYLLRSLTAAGFIETVEQMAEHEGSLAKAYHKVEDDLEKYFDYRRYADLNSFRRVRYQRQRKR
jgi:hypothetical protein